VRTAFFKERGVFEHTYEKRLWITLGSAPVCFAFFLTSNPLPWYFSKGSQRSPDERSDIWDFYNSVSECRFACPCGLFDKFTVEIDRDSHIPRLMTDNLKKLLEAAKTRIAG
jgi:hypothetical protein